MSQTMLPHPVATDCSLALAPCPHSLCPSSWAHAPTLTNVPLSLCDTGEQNIILLIFNFVVWLQDSTYWAPAQDS